MESSLSIQDIRNTLAEVSAILKEVSESQKETDLRFKQTEKMLNKKFKETKEMFKETKEMFKDTDKKFKETDKKFKETDKKFKETEDQIKETGKQIKAAQNLFTSQWGKLIESLVEGEIVKLFKAKGIQVDRISTRVSGSMNGENYEYDIIAYNGTEIVIVEVKTTLRVEGVNKHLSKLERAKEWMPVYKNHKIYGCVAFLRAEEHSHIYAETKGLWVIKATGDSAYIINNKEFQPDIY